MNELQLLDYQDGYRFRVKCTHCHYSWYENPQELIQRADAHAHMYLEEVSNIIACKSCKHSTNIITPIRSHARHSFVGGMA